MIRLRKILLCNFFFYIILGVIFLLTFIRLNINYRSNYNLFSKVFSGVVTNINSSCDRITLELTDKNREKTVAYYYVKNNDEKNKILSRIKLGIKLKIEGEFFKVAKNIVPNTFNYRKYLERNKIFYCIKVDNIKLIDDDVSLFYRVKNFIVNYFSSFKSSRYLKILILGITTEVDKNVVDSYREIGISHLFAISGTQVSVVCTFLLKILQFMRVKEEKRYLIVDLFSIFYLVLTGCQAAILRAVIFFILSSINKIHYFYISEVNLFYLTVALTLLIKPSYIFDLGFQYSYLISYVLILLSKKISSNYFVSLLQISWYSFLVSIPITLYNFYEVNFLSIVYNLFFVPYVSNLLFPLSFIVLFCPVLDGVLVFFINILESLSLYIANIDVLKLIFPRVSIGIYIFYYVVLLVIYICKRRFLYILLLVLMCIHYNYYNIVSCNRVVVIDVGQGDSTLITLGKESMLIDTGGVVSYKSKGCGDDTVNFSISNNILYMKSLGIRKLKYLVITHGDFDHMGNSFDLVNNFRVENVIFNYGKYNYLEKNLIEMLDRKGISYYKDVSNMRLGHDTLYFLNTLVLDNENNNSNVLYFRKNNIKFLFMGDAGVVRERNILDDYNLEEIDFIKVGHHGSDTSSSKYFIENVKPKNCLISVGKNNRYGHPKEEVLDILDDYCDIYRTDLNGSIEIKINKKNYKIKTYSP